MSVMNHADQQDHDWLDLTDVVGLLREQIAQAKQKAVDTDVQFGLGRITVEIGMELARSRNGGALRFHMVGVSAKQDRSHRTTHKIAFTLDPTAISVNGLRGPINVGNQEAVTDLESDGLGTAEAVG